MQEPDDELEGETLELSPEQESEVEDTEDGGAIIRLSNEQNDSSLEHFANIADEVPPSDLARIVTDLLDKVERDKEARAKRDKLYEEGLRRTGLGDDAPGGAAFAGANKVVHPMLVEACVDFSARVMKEIFPSSGPIKTKIAGVQDRKKLEKAKRKAEYMNWQCTKQMLELRSDIEQLTTQLPLGGGQYMKLRFDRKRRRAMSEFVPIDDVYLPYAATNFYSAERKTHVQYLTASEYEARCKSGMYLDVDITLASEPDQSAARKANDKIEGKTATSYNEDGLRTVFEIYTDLDFGEGSEPYVITIDKQTSRCCSLYRNWDEEDENKEELVWLIEFGFIPWRGAYPIGLTHMIGSLSGAATGALRALLDSAHIQNAATLLKLKGGPNGQTITVQPTQVVELEGGAMVDDIRKLAMPLPFNGPSPTLFQLLGFLNDAGKGVVQTSFEKLADGNVNTPVGTTFALIEQGMVVFSSINARMHNSMERLFSVLHRINSAYLTEEDIKRQKLGFKILPQDFDGPMDVSPVSDPNIFSETQRFAQSQAIQARAAQMPQLYDLRKVEEMFLHSMKIEPENVLVEKPGQKNSDPATENVAATMGQPIYVLPKQDHIAHLKLHLAFFNSPVFGMNPVIARTYALPMVNHLRDHILNHYLTQSHEAVEKASEVKVIGDDAGQQARVIAQVQQLIEQQLQGVAQILVKADQFAQQFNQPPPIPGDNTMQVAQLNAQSRAQTAQMSAQAKAQDTQMRLQADAQKNQQQLALEQARLQEEAKQTQAKIQADALIAQQAEEGDNARTTAEINARLTMNAEDNETAMRLAAAEIASGERVAVSTGTGINPNP